MVVFQGIRIMNTDVKGLVFDIQGHSVHDGPGSRTTIFLKGCPLHCDWCCNPEGIHHQQEMLYYESRCIHCGRCIDACPSDAISIVNNQLSHNRDICIHCETHDCIKACLNEAKCEVGDYYSCDEMMRILNRDRQFWSADGGVTFSGGEPLMQKKFILEMLKRCKENYINTCIETTSHVNTDYYLEAMHKVDWVFTDIKHMDTVAHKQRTGVGNQRILQNIEALAKDPLFDGVVVVRVPVIEGYNATEENIIATARFIKSIGLDALNLLPFHRMGESKHRQLDQEYRYADMTPPPAELMKTLQKAASAEGIYCFIGHETPF